MVTTYISNDTLSVLVSTLVITTVVLVFGEVVPKTIAVGRPEGIALFTARILDVLGFIFQPIVTVLRGITLLVARPLGVRALPGLVTQEEIRTLISTSQEAGVVEPHEAQMIHNVLSFGDTKVKQIMVPRSEIIAIPRGMTLREFQAVYAVSPHSEFPVYGEGMDDVTGMLSVKDLFKEQSLGNVRPDTDVTSIIRPPHFVPETNTVDKLFIEMRDLRIQVALAVDEYGALAGLVTLKQVMQEIVGHVGDEIVREQQIERINETTLRVDGDLRIDSFNEAIPLNLPADDYETVAGYIMHSLGRLPKQGEVLKVGDSRMIISDMEGRKIEKVTLILGPSIKLKAESIHPSSMQPLTDLPGARPKENK
jgi:putative hemolysin